MDLTTNVLFLFILAMPIASIAWTVTHEEVVGEFRDYCIVESKTTTLPQFFLSLPAINFCIQAEAPKREPSGWRGHLIAGFSLVSIANMYMGIFGGIRLDIRKERAEIAVDEGSLAVNRSIK